MSIYSDSVLRIQPSNLIGYWPLWEASGDIAEDISGNNNHGFYTGTVILNQSGIGDGRSSIYCTGTISHVNIFTPELASSFSGDQCTISLWFRIPSDSWVDGVGRYIFTLTSSSSANRVSLRRTASNLVQFDRTITITVGSALSWGSYSGWINACMRIDRANSNFKIYRDGVQSGSTRTITTNFTQLIAYAKLGIDHLHSSSNFIGNLAHYAIWNIALDEQEILQLASVPIGKSSIRVRDELYYISDIRDK